MRRLIKLTAFMFVVFFYAINGWAVSGVACEVTGWGNFLTGEMFEGTASDVDGTEMIDWSHNGFVDSTEIYIEIDNDVDSISCNINGEINADFLGEGTATVNGDSGFSYLIYIEDNREPSDMVPLIASITHRPTLRSDGMVIFAVPKTVVIPYEIDIISGNSGKGLVKLHLDGIMCKYLGTGPTYAFDRCGSGNVVGDSLDITQARLRIQQSEKFVTTVVKTDIGTGVPAAGDPDYYSIEVYDSEDSLVYSFDGFVEDGDISIVQIPPAP